MTVYDLLALIPLSCAAYQDKKQRIIPDWTCALIAFCALLKLLDDSSARWLQMVGSGVAIGLLLLVSNAAGGGDIKLCAALGFLLGFSEVLFILILALVFLVLCRMLRRQQSLPFAPFLWIAFIAAGVLQIIL